ncbi:MAG TPA: 2,3-bisphosphoglycerate-independent phosphoglycerate mutase [Desulfobacteraceae bacterium]|nr:2,3-bisphosphoglycerate-independent phosphoglycerate mutase [Desulfobacteraceae bacterium]|tara:strand:+ start:1941 stop:3497 length:1557 start_codon:yes stop_codon:yes gene_type:complete
MTSNPDRDNSADKPVTILMILDGWGINEDLAGNAVAMAHTPFLDQLLETFPSSRLNCSGPDVGLPGGTMGNSEVGHMNIGAGRVVPQDFVRINTAIKDRSFFKNPVLEGIMSGLKQSGNTLHLLGLLSDGGVHSHITHLFALMEMAKAAGLTRVCIHPILDGRDTSPTSGITFVRALHEKATELGVGHITSLVGRYWAMDRDTRWDRVEKAFDLYTQGKGASATDPLAAVQAAYNRDETDEFIKPVFFGDPSKDCVRNGDGIIFFNFRADRAKEITRAFTEPAFQGFARKTTPALAGFVSMTQYDETFDLPAAFAPQHLTGILGEVISRAGLPQLRIAETEKYAHVTYFFNGGDEAVFPGEERVLIPSPRDVATYDKKPAMSAEQVTREACNRIRSGKYPFIVLNFANMDMVGHTGIVDAAVMACETVDNCVRQVVEAIWETGGTAFITADHGNSEQMVAQDGSPHTAHTLNPVRFIVAGNRYQTARVKDGRLGDIAPTILKAMALEQPPEMTGKSLI